MNLEGSVLEVSGCLRWFLRRSKVLEGGTYHRQVFWGILGLSSMGFSWILGRALLVSFGCGIALIFGNDKK